MIETTTCEELAAIAAAHSPGVSPEVLEKISSEAAGIHIDPEAVQRILDAFDALADTVKKLAEALAEILRPLAEWATNVARRLYEAVAACIAPRKWLHLAKHAKKARTRKKYRRRIRLAVLAALADGGSS